MRTWMTSVLVCAMLLGGRLEVHTRPNYGTEVEALIPYHLMKEEVLEVLCERPQDGPALRRHPAPARSEPPGRAIQVHGLSENQFQ